MERWGGAKTRTALSLKRGSNLWRSLTTRCNGPVPAGRGPHPRELASAAHVDPLCPAAARGVRLLEKRRR